jgi:arginine repressor
MFVNLLFQQTLVKVERTSITTQIEVYKYIENSGIKVNQFKIT